MLKRYKNSFYTAAYEQRLIDSTVPLIHGERKEKRSEKYKGVTAFRYRSGSKLCWNPWADMYAVSAGSGVYVCHSQSHSEIANAFVVDSTNDKCEIRETVWLNADMLGVVTYQNKLFI